MYIEDEKRKSVILEDGELHTFISSTFFFPQDDPLRIVTIFRNFPFFLTLKVLVKLLHFLNQDFFRMMLLFSPFYHAYECYPCIWKRPTLFEVNFIKKF